VTGFIIDTVENPWGALDMGGPEYVLASDRPHVDVFNAYRERTLDDRRFLNLKLLPEPFSGRRDAPVVILGRNPTYDDLDQELHATNVDYREKLLANLADDPSGQVLVHALSTFRHTHSGRWWYRCLAPLIQATSEEAISRRVFVAELHGYHAKGWALLPVPSQRFTFWLVEQAVRERGALVVHLWQQHELWEVFVPPLFGYERAFHLKPAAGRGPKAVLPFKRENFAELDAFERIVDTVLNGA
jgi:hypothetical protein